MCSYIDRPNIVVVGALLTVDGIPHHIHPLDISYIVEVVYVCKYVLE